MTSRSRCRWCDNEFREHQQADAYYKCPVCNAYTVGSLSFNTTGNEAHVVFWHNPDNSMYIEFVGDDGRTARYTLSAEVLAKGGALEFFDTPPEGRRR